MMVHLGDRRGFGRTKEIQSGVARNLLPGFAVYKNQDYFAAPTEAYKASGTREIAGTSALQPESMTAFSLRFGQAFFVVSVTCPAPVAKE